MSKTCWYKTFIPVILLLQLWASGWQPGHCDEPIVRLLSRKPSTVPVLEWLWAEDTGNQAYPHVMMLSDQIVFQNSTGERLTSHFILPGSDISHSPGKTCVAFITKEEDGGTHGQKKVTFYVSGFQGEMVTSYSNRFGYDDGIPQILVKDDGSSVLLEACRQRLKFYNANGHLATALDLFENNVFDYEKPLCGVLSADGSYIAVSAQVRPVTVDALTDQTLSGEPYFVLFEADGRELWRRRLSGAHAGKVAFVGEGLILASSYTSNLNGAVEKITTAFSRLGAELFSIPELFEFAVMSGDAIVVADKHSLWIVAAKNGRILNHWLAPSERLVVDLKVANEQVLVATARNHFENGRFVYDDLTLHSLDITGRLIKKQKFRDVNFVRPSFWYQPGSNRFVIGHEFGFSIYEVSR